MHVDNFATHVVNFFGVVNDFTMVNTMIKLVMENISVFQCTHRAQRGAWWAAATPAG